MSGDLEWELQRLAQRVANLERWRATVQGAGGPEPKAEPVDEVQAWEERARKAGASEAELGQIRARIGRDKAAHVGWLQERAEENDLRARARRGGIDLDDERERPE